MRNLFLAILAITLTSVSQISHAYDLNLRAKAKLEATIGLDRNTIRFLDRYPEKVKSEIVDTIRKALPLIDKSVIGYLEEVDSLVTNNIDKAICLSAVPIGHFFDKLKEFLGYKSNPVQEIINDYSEVVSSFSEKTDPKKYTIIYSGFLYRAATTSCQVSRVPEAVAEISVFQQKARSRWQVWSRLENKCKNADDCFDHLLTRVQQLALTANDADMSTVNVTKRLSAIEPPPTLGFLEAIFSNFSAEAHEEALEELYSILDGVRVAEALRKASAEADFEDGVAIVRSAQQAYSNAVTKLKSHKISDLQSVTYYKKEVLNLRPTLRGKFDNAIAADPDIKIKTSVQFDEYERLESLAIKAEDEANGKMRAIVQDLAKPPSHLIGPTR